MCWLYTFLSMFVSFTESNISVAHKTIQPLKEKEKNTKNNTNWLGKIIFEWRAYSFRSSFTLDVAT